MPETTPAKRPSVATLSEPAAPVNFAPERSAGPRSAAELVGFDPARLVRLLGAPTLKRRDPPAEVWQYAGKACTLHLFLYHGAAGDYRVLHAETSAPVDGRDCLDALLAERQPPPRES